MVTDAQVRRLMEEKAKHGEVGLAALRAGMHRETARKYLDSGQLPSESKPERTWKTRPDPFDADWEEVRARLRQEASAGARSEDAVRVPRGQAPGQVPAGPGADTAAARTAVACDGGARPRGVLRAGASTGRGDADRLHIGERAAGHHRGRGVRAPAVSPGVALQQLGVGDGVPVGVVDGTAARD